MRVRISQHALDNTAMNTRLKHPSIIVLSILMLSWTFNSHAVDQKITPFSASYIAENNFMKGGVAWLVLTPGQSHDGYDLVLQTKPTGILKWSDKGRIREHAVLPTLDPFESSSYSYANQGNKKKNISATFLRSDNTAMVTYAGKTTSVALEGQATDRLSMMLAVMIKLGVSVDFKKLEIDVLDGLEVRKMTFDNLGTETIATALGELSALRIHRSRENSSRETITWFAALPHSESPNNSDQMVPVKIEQYKNGKLSMRLKISDFKFIE